MFLLNVPMGRLCDTIGRKPLMYGGTALTAVGSVLTGLSGSFGSLLAARFVVGSGVCTSMTGSSAYLADLTDRVPQYRAKIMGVNSAITGSVWVVGPAVGGWLAEHYGFRNSFFIAGIGSALCSLGYMQLPETLKAKVSPSPWPFQGLGNAEAAKKGGAQLESWQDAMRVQFSRWLSDVK